MVLCRITLVHSIEELQAADTGIISLFYTDDAAFGGLERRSTQILNLLMERGADQGYFPNPSNSLFIAITPGQEEAANRYLRQRAKI